MNRDQLLALRAPSERLPRAEVRLPGDQVVRVRQLTAGEFGRLQALAKLHKDRVGAEVLLVLFATCDEVGGRLFAESDLDEVAALPGVVVQAIAARANDLNSFDDGTEAGN